MKLKNLIPAIIISLTLAINFAFGFSRLTDFSAVDEHLWTYDRTPVFWDSIAKHRWKSTSINDKPGVTVAIVSGLGLLEINPKPYNPLRQGEKAKTAEQAELMKKINFNFRLPLYLFILSMAPVFYILLKKLFNKTIALLSIILIYLSPVLLGISLFINPDSLLWVFVPLSILSFLLFQKNNEKKYAVLSGLFFGLALLSKYVASLLYPFLIILIILNYIFLEKKRIDAQYFKKSLIGYGLVLLISTLVVAILYPAGWAEPKYIWGTTFLCHPFKPVFPYFAGLLALFSIDTFFLKSRLVSFFLSLLIKYKNIFLRLTIALFIATVLFILINTYLGMPFYDFQSELTLAKFKKLTSFISKIFVNGIMPGTYILIFSLIPIVFLFFIYSICMGFTKKIETEKDTILPAFYMLVFILLYYVTFAISNVYPIVRYQISLYPIVSIIAAIGIYQFINLEKIKKYIPIFAVYLLLMAISIASLVLIKPYYFAYISDLLPKQYVLNLNDMGDGSFEAAEYLNSLPDAQNLTIWSDKVAVCEYFVGTCKISLKKKNIADAYFDYYVVSQARGARTVNLLQKGGLRGEELTKFENIYSSDNPSDYKIIIGNRPDNFVKIVKNVGSEIK